jgi:hypothetical protein
MDYRNWAEVADRELDEPIASLHDTYRHNRAAVDATK